MKLKNIIKALPHVANQKRFLSEAKSIVLSEKKIVISLTCVPYRFHSLHIVLASLLNQSVEPLEIHLWLDPESYKKLPNKVRLLEKYGVCFHEVDDLRSYKKLIFALREFPEHTIITVDDDVIYPKWWLEHLLLAHKNHPQDILAFRTKRIKLDEDGNVFPYRAFVGNKVDHPSLYHLPIGCAGVLYPPNSLAPEVQNVSYFMDNCRTADDLWFKAMSLMNKTNCRLIGPDFGKEINPPFTQGRRLTKVNVKKNLNDVQLQQLFRDYPLSDILKTESYCD